MVPLKALVQEVVEVGFKSGLLSADMARYPSGEAITDVDGVTESAWSGVGYGQVSPC